MPSSLRPIGSLFDVTSGVEAGAAVEEGVEAGVAEDAAGEAAVRALDLLGLRGGVGTSIGGLSESLGVSSLIATRAF